jgi:hypothetical protein
MEIKPRYSLETILANLPPGLDPLLPPALAAELAGVTKKWLASAREGLKTIKGPPYVKLGEGRTAPVLYRLSSLQAWMDALQEQTSTLERPAVPHRSFGRFMSDAASSDRWLFVISDDRRSATEIFTALAEEQLKSDIQLQWLTLAEYTSKRFVRAHLQLDADTLEQLIAVGNGDASVGLEKLLKPN